MNQDAKEWHINADSRQPFDPLLGCLIFLSKHFDSPCSKEALTSGLPLINNRLDPELFIRAAERAKLSASIVKAPIKDLTEALFPAVLLLHNQKSCIITEISFDQKIATIIYPETGEGTEVLSFDDLRKIYTGYAIFVKPAYQFDKRANAPTPESGKGWFWQTIRQTYPIYTEVLIASFLINCFVLASPLFIMNVYDRVVPNKAITTLWVLSTGVIIVFAFDFLMRNIRSYFVDTAAKQIDVKLSRTIFERILGIEQHSRPNSVGAFVHTVQAFEAFRDFITSATMSTLVDLPFVIIFLSVIGFLAGSIVLLPLLMIPLILCISLLIQIPLSRLVKQSFQHSAEKQAVLIESIGCVETLKSARGEGLMQRRWEVIINASANLQKKILFLTNLGSNFSVFAQYLCSIAVVIYGVHKIADGDISMGALIASTILTGRALAPITQVALLISRYQQALAGFNSVNNIMQLPVERPSDKHFLHRPELKGGIEFKNVSFSYPNNQVPALQNISFKINPGEKVGIVGRIGSGKSTLEKLILKLYTPTHGSILIDDTELHQIDPAELRNSIGYVPQDVVLFHGSVKNNIVVGAPYVDDNAIIRAAEIGGLAHFINSHPDGFDREVGERGSQLSGGQRQSIAISRALLLDPPILVFDEPTNCMDDSTTSAFIQRLVPTITNKTLIIVTHKSNVLHLVDRLIVLDEQGVIADGPKEDVLEQLASGKIKAAAHA